MVHQMMPLMDWSQLKEDHAQALAQTPESQRLPSYSEAIVARASHKAVEKGQLSKEPRHMGMAAITGFFKGHVHGAKQRSAAASVESPRDVKGSE